MGVYLLFNVKMNNELITFYDKFLVLYINKKVYRSFLIEKNTIIKINRIHFHGDRNNYDNAISFIVRFLDIERKVGE
jgi:hypothetical protein